ncbi:MAG: gamma-glutamyl-gamma-aminobutyrate hydrolase family protein, partial [Planctomycetales bacterium]|nr:gamma-glutamyl-gamma-aminobutyrate hydrolase family protein [Planctomycetales bacterium]
THVVKARYVTGVREFADAVPVILPGFAAPADAAQALARLDGVLLTGSVATITVDYSHATADAVLNAWIDFDGSGSFDMGEEIAIDEPLVAGTVHTLQVAIPPDAVVGDSFARFRVSTEEGLSAIGPAFDGEVEDYLIPIENGLDFGDAPEPDYSTLLNAVTGGGPRHLITGIYLGSSIDAEADGQPHARALGDDLNSSDDEDGIRFLTPLEPGMMATIEVTATIPAGSPTVYLNGWFDFRADGDWDDPGEHPVALSDATIVNGTQTISFAVPAWVTPGLETFARFRLSTSDFANDFLGPDGILPTLPDPTVPDGEVEDYPIMLGDVLDFGDLPDEAGPLGTPMYPTLLVNNGARHSILSGVFLGQRLDSETDGQPDALATGDDTNGMDDEDGVIFSQMIPGGQATMTVTASADGYVSAWVDFNNDGDLDDANEWIAAAQPVVVGINTLTFNVPPNAIPATTSDPLTYARVRYELSDDILDPDGAADPGDGGEVEDYAVTIGDLPTLSVNDVSVTELDRGQSSTVTFTVSLAVPYSNTVTVDYSTSDGTARSSTADYTPVSGQLTFAPGVTSQTVTVTVPGDISDEADETFFLNLSNAVNASIADAQGTATIVDNDTATVAYTIVLRDPSVAGQPEFPRGTDGLYRLAPGSQFIAEVYADDLRAVGANGGVFQGFADLGYDPDLFDWVAGTLTYGSQFTANQGGSIDDPNQLVDGAGGSIPAFPPPAPVG